MSRKKALVCVTSLVTPANSWTTSPICARSHIPRVFFCYENRTDSGINIGYSNILVRTQRRIFCYTRMLFGMDESASFVEPHTFQNVMDLGSLHSTPEKIDSKTGDGTLDQLNSRTESSNSNTESVLTFQDLADRRVLQEETPPEINVALHLTDELHTMRQFDLARFIRSKRNARVTPMEEFVCTPGTRKQTQLLLELIHHAEEEAEGTYGFSSVTQKFGQIEEETKKALRSREWNDRSLEAAHLEYSCKTSIQRDTMTWKTPELSLRRHGRTVRILAQRLLKAAHEEYDSASIAAVGGVHRTFREQSLAALRTVPLRDLVAVFSRFCAKHIMHTGCPAFMSVSSHLGNTLVDQGVLCRPTSEDNMLSLSRMMGLLDTLESEVEHSLNLKNLQNENVASALSERITRHKSRFAQINTSKDVPEFVLTLASQFQQWERLVRNDIPILSEVSEKIFDDILLGVTTVRIMKVFTDSVSTSISIPFVRDFTRILRYDLEVELKDDHIDAIEALNGYCSLPNEKVRLDVTLFETINNAHLSAIGMDNTPPSRERLGLIMWQVARVASEAPGTYSLYELLVGVTKDMAFHLRYGELYKRMSVYSRHELLFSKTVSWDRLRHLEKEHNIIPMSTKTVAFMCTIFMYLLTISTINPTLNGFGARKDAPLLRFIPPCEVDDFSVLGLTWQKPSTDLKVALPPQFEHRGWMDADQDKGIYRMLPSKPVLGAMSDLFVRTKPPMMAAMDCLSRVPWRINRFILHVQEMIVVEGFGFHKIMPAFHPLPYLSMPTGYVPCKSIETSDEFQSLRRFMYDDNSRIAFRAQREADRSGALQVFSSRQHYLMACRTARTMVNKSKIYFPHKLDFRGRMYPLVGRLNHTGSDPFRAMVEFADPVPLGKDGFYWLKVHLANVMGQTKLTFEERVQYVDDHLDDLVQSAESPLGGDRWWQEGDEPLQALQACREIYNAMSYSQNIEDFPSHIPVHIDGSCNGLQHYSAIGRDYEGGVHVNLVPSKRPQDVYMGVLKELISMVEEDAANENAVALRCLGSGVNLDTGHLKRKTIKRAVMTQVYGVTFFGMHDMILKELEMQNNNHHLWTTVVMKEMATYLRDKLVRSLGKTFGKAQACRQWLDKVAARIWMCQPPSMQQCFQWTTPLGLIVRQPYTKGSNTPIFTPIRVY